MNYREAGYNIFYERPFYDEGDPLQPRIARMSETQVTNIIPLNSLDYGQMQGSIITEINTDSSDNIEATQLDIGSDCTFETEGIPTSAIDYDFDSIPSGSDTFYYGWLSSQPWLASSIAKNTWTGETGQNLCEGLTYDGRYLYASLYTTPAQVLQIDPSDMTVNATWTGESGENYGRRLTYDGTYVYVALNLSPGKMIQIDTSDMTTNGTFTADSGENSTLPATCDGTYVYTATLANNTTVYQIDPSDMTTNDTWNKDGSSDYDNCASLHYDGTYIYGASATASGYIWQIDPSDMSLNDTHLEANFAFQDMAFDGTYIYVAGQYSSGGDNNRIVKKIDPSDMSEADIYEAAGLWSPYRITYDGTYLYFYHSNGSSVGTVEKLDPSDMSLVSTYTIAGSSGDNPGVVTTDGIYVYMGTSDSPADIHQKIIKNIDETGS